MRSNFRRSTLAALRGFTLPGDAITILPSAADYRRCLLEKIATATRRIYVIALYLQQDEAGQEILDALYAAKAARPELDVVVLVDAPEEVRLRRIVADRGLDEDEARRMIAAQMPAELKRARADIAIDNTGTLGDLQDRARDVWKQLARRAEERG